MEAMIVAEGVNRAVLDWFVEHREPWLDAIMQTPVLGSSVLLIPLIPLVVAVSGWYWRRHGTARPFGLLAATYGGAYLVSQPIKVLVGRPRPPADVAIGAPLHVSSTCACAGFHHGHRGFQPATGEQNVQTEC